MEDFHELRKELEGLRKFFLSPEGIIFKTENLHEVLAREICEENCWTWKNDFFSAADFLLTEKKFVKVSNYGPGRAFRCVMIHSSCGSEVEDTAYWIADIFNLRVERF